MELYKIKKGGNISVFKISLNTVLVMMYGTYKGKMTKKVINSEKKQLLSIKKNKLKELYSKGYKELQDYRDKCSEIIDVEDITKHFKFNFNKNWTPLPMLANTVNIETISYPRIIQPKLDGVRCLALKHDDRYIMISRKGEIFNLPYILNEVKHLIDKYTILDGELYIHGKPLSEISGIARKQMPDMFGEKLQYHIYDLGNKNNNSMRITMMKNIVETEIVKVVASTKVYNTNEVNQLHDIYVEGGYEGAILRDMFGFYEFGFRSNNLLKVKKYLDAEFELIGFDIKLNDIDTLNGVFITEDEKEFKVKLKGTREERKRQYNDRFIGNWYTIRYLNLSVNNIPEKAQVNLLNDKYIE